MFWSYDNFSCQLLIVLHHVLSMLMSNIHLFGYLVLLLVFSWIFTVNWLDLREGGQGLPLHNFAANHG